MLLYEGVPLCFQLLILYPQRAKYWQDLGIAISVAIIGFSVCKCLSFHTCPKVEGQAVPKALGSQRDGPGNVLLLVEYNKEPRTESQ